MFYREKAACRICGGDAAAQAPAVCPKCIRQKPEKAVPVALEAHAVARRVHGLPPEPPKTEDGIPCNVCANGCRMGEGERGFCGLRWSDGGRLGSLTSPEQGVLHAYYDTLPTNCCAAWYCPCSRERGSSLAVFFYGCGFDCLFCQNSSHKDFTERKPSSVDDLRERAHQEDVKCVCFFGGDPEPQLPYALNAVKSILEDKPVRVCWELNGSGNPKLLDQAAELSLKTGGIMKFDLKAYDENLHKALCGVPNKQTLENFARVGEKHLEGSSPPVLTATTLLVPGYVDAGEVERIAEFIAGVDDSIPYSLLLFHPDYMMSDLPCTPRTQMEACKRAAEKHLKRVNVGNKHLLGLL